MERELFTSSVERDVEKLLRVSNIHVPKYFSIQDIQLPKTALVEEAVKFAKDELDETMFNHSNRVFLLGHVVSQDQFPEWKIDDEKYFLTSILHDIGVAPKFHLTTSMSFEFKGGLISHSFITSKQKDKHGEAIADEVSEAIIRHTDFVEGKIQPLGQLIQLATTLDVIGANPDLYNMQTVDEIVKLWPRKNFNNHFAKLMELEIEHKPGSHTTFPACSNFVYKIKNNKVMEKYDQ
jgi:cyanamide hydratase